MSDDTNALTPLDPQALAQAPGPLDLAIAAWLDAKAGRSGSQRTRGAYASTLGDARAALASVGLDLDGPPAAVALALQGWSRSSKVGRELRPSTVAHRLATANSFYSFALRRGLVPGLASNPAALVEPPRVESYGKVAPLDPAAVRKALAQLRREAAGDGPAAELAARDLALLRVALTTGRRVAELAALRWSDLWTDGRQVAITIRRAKGGKTARDALAAGVAADLLAWLHRHYGGALGELPQDAPLWPALRPGGRPGRARVGAPLSAEGVAELVQRRLGTHPHALRHSFAHAMRKAGAPDSEIQHRLGHSSLSTTGRYLAQLDQAENPHAGELDRLFGGDET